MKKHCFRLLLTLVFGLCGSLAHAQETVTQATITSLTGSATIKRVDGSSSPATAGMKVDQGATIVTAKDGRVALLVHDGIAAVLAGSSEVTLEKMSVSASGMRSAMLNLKTGNLASSLDPARKSTNNYGVRTAKGVAMARGTDLTVTVNGNVYLVAVINGNVQVTWSGGQSVSITGNTATAVTTNNNGTTTSGSLSSAMSAGGSATLTDALTAAAAAVATIATSTTQVTALINTIATAAGTSSTASTTVASATAAAIGAAVSNPALVPAGSGTGISVATTISTAAVTSATAAGNGSAAEVILVSAGNAVVQSVPGAKLNDVAKTLTQASNNVQGNTQVKAAEVISGVNAPQNPGTPVTAIDPTINVSISG